MRRTLSTAGPILLALCAASAALAPAREDPPSRALLLELTRRPRLAGTPESRWAADLVARRLREAGLGVEVDEREVLLSLPRRLELELFEGEGGARVLLRRERFDPDAHPPGDVPPFNAWSASAEVRAPVIDAGRGLRSDFEALLAAGVDPRGTIALMRYGGSYRGIKARLAQEFGCVGALLFSDPADDGPEKGETWPAGPWKPDHEAQRGSIVPFTGAPGDPSTPGWPSPAPGGASERPRRSGPELDAALPRIPCMPIPWREARAILERLAERELATEEGAAKRKLGPGPVEARVLVDAPRELRPIRNVIGRIDGRGPELVIAGNHRDAWVRGATDAGGGTVALIRAAQRLGERAGGGWRPQASILFCFWDAEETGLIGSIEWAEAKAAELRAHAVCYVNGDVLVHGTEFRGASGSPGLLGALSRALSRVPAAGGSGSLLDQWAEAAGEAGPRLSLPGSGSDFAAFVHHLSVPVLDLGLSGAAGGQYHTAFDDFALVERFVDPGFVGHETAGRMMAELLAELADAGAAAFDEVEAARELERVAREEESWLGAERTASLAGAFRDLAARLEVARAAPPLGDERFYAVLEAKDGLPGRAWYRNRLWTPGLELGYGTETFPELRAARAEGEEALDEATERLTAAVKMLAMRRSPDAWVDFPGAEHATGE